MITRAGWIFQLVGLSAMPTAIVIGEMTHDERRMIAVFAASLFVFFFGFLLTRFSKP